MCRVHLKNISNMVEKIYSKKFTYSKFFFKIDLKDLHLPSYLPLSAYERLCRPKIKINSNNKSKSAAQSYTT